MGIGGKRRRRPPPWTPVLIYGAALAAGAVLLQWLDYRHLVRAQTSGWHLALVAAGFLALGVFVGVRVVGARRPHEATGNTAAQASLGISDRELAVLRELAAGRSNKEVALRLGVSPNTIKTHVARLHEKLGARRRTDAIARARELGLIR
ncbi:response regulator transcription factor [Sphingomonas sp. ID1715]|uniref:response regulator transcription factor n=1 Tax=Sphingomonas sp. ID1715 TaxID=1656898 RepID=UPI0014887D0C|nr:LuxR C-terminal-related transcriptional regulator [Sphingomonas sp. ID1715]NNM78266.1 response regulator transcription factor [Sphingomonas sp. ID1715]